VTAHSIFTRLSTAAGGIVVDAAAAKSFEWFAPCGKVRFQQVLLHFKACCVVEWPVTNTVPLMLRHLCAVLVCHTCDKLIHG
jgi:hypothetical protein